MNNKTSLKKLISLSQELEAAASAEPYDPDVYNNVIDRLNALHFFAIRPKRRRPWSALIFTIFLLIVLLWLVLEILCLLWIRGTL